MGAAPIEYSPLKSAANLDGRQGARARTPLRQIGATRAARCGYTIPILAFSASSLSRLTGIRVAA
jgi:hypothetical protein